MSTIAILDAYETFLADGAAPLAARPESEQFAGNWPEAASSGFRTVWVRAGAPVERLPGQPCAVVPDLAPVAGLT